MIQDPARTPGAGKSSLVARRRMLAESDLSVAVLAVDPSSRIGRGFAGRPTRTRFATGDKRAYFRSQSNGRARGLAPTTFQVSRLLKRLFDVVLGRPSGSGQSELTSGIWPTTSTSCCSRWAGMRSSSSKPASSRSRLVHPQQVRRSSGGYVILPTALVTVAGPPFDEDQPPVYKTSARTGEGRQRWPWTCSR